MTADTAREAEIRECIKTAITYHGDLSEVQFLLRLLDEARAEIAKWEGVHNQDSGKIEELHAEPSRLRAAPDAALERAKEVMRGYCSEYGYDVDGESYEDVIPWIAAVLAEVRRAAAKQCETALTGLLIDPVTVEADRAGLGRAIIAIRALSPTAKEPQN